MITVEVPVDAMLNLLLVLLFLQGLCYAMASVFGGILVVLGVRWIFRRVRPVDIGRLAGKTRRDR